MALLFTAILPCQAQFKTTYELDPDKVFEVSGLTAEEIIPLDSQGNRLAVTGKFNGKDQFNQSITPFYVFQMEADGSPGKLTYINNDPNSGQNALSFSICANNNSIYAGGAANYVQTLTKLDTSGTLQWAREAGHHEFYSLEYDEMNDQLVALGLSEPTSGGHDMLLVQVDKLGNFIRGRKFGIKTGYDTPGELLVTDQGYYVAGTASDPPHKDLMLFKVDPASLDLEWSRIYRREATANHNFGDMALSRDSTTITMTGYIRGSGTEPKDTLFLFRTDTSGTPLWFRKYQSNPSTALRGNGIDKDPVSGHLLIAGQYSEEGTNNRHPFVMNTDTTGSTDWIYDYSETGPSTDETLNDIYCHQGSDQFTAIGNLLYDYGNGNLEWRFMAVTGRNSVGRNGCESPVDMVRSSDPVFVYSDTSVVTESFSTFGNFNSYIANNVTAADNERCQLPVKARFTEPSAFPFKVYPNPTNGPLLVTFPSNRNEPSALQVINRMGEKVMEKTIPGSSREISLDLSWLPTGIYSLRIHQKGKASVSRKVVLTDAP